MKHAAIALGLLLATLLFGCKTSDKEIAFADAGWDSVRFHSAVAGLIARQAYDLQPRLLAGTSVVLHEGLKKGEVDVHMEIWTDNMPTYAQDLKAGSFQELGVNFDDNASGFYVPRYVIEGDPKRGIPASAPDLRSVADLKKYSKVFTDEEDPSKGRIYGAVPGWEADAVMYNKVRHYGLDETYVYFRPGSDAALTAVLSTAYEKGKPVVGYYWEPTWLLGKNDFVLLEDAPYTGVAAYQEGKTACPSMRVAIGASNALVKKHPEFAAFLRRYKTSSALTAQALAHMQTTGAGYDDTARWFLRGHGELLDAWLPADKAAKVRAALR